MAGDQLVSLLTEIRDQQKQQIDNFERAVLAQTDYVALQRKSRKMFLFLVYTPWIAMLFLFARSFLAGWV